MGSYADADWKSIGWRSENRKYYFRPSVPSFRVVVVLCPWCPIVAVVVLCPSSGRPGPSVPSLSFVLCLSVSSSV